MAFYTGSEIREKALIGHRDGNEYQVLDDAAVLEFFAEHSQKDARAFTHAVLSNESFWGQDLSSISGAEETICAYLADIRESGMRRAMEKYFQK